MNDETMGINLQSCLATENRFSIYKALFRRKKPDFVNNFLKELAIISTNVGYKFDETIRGFVYPEYRR